MKHNVNKILNILHEGQTRNIEAFELGLKEGMTELEKEHLSGIISGVFLCISWIQNNSAKW